MFKWENMKKIFDSTSRWYRETRLSEEQRELLVRRKLERIHEYHRQQRYWLEQVAKHNLR